MSGALPLILTPDDSTATWIEPPNGKGSATLIRLANNHYTRQTHGSNQCCRPGFNYVLTLTDGTAAWVVWRPDPTVGRMDLLECWECTLFRNEGPRLSSDLVREATALTYRSWGWPPPGGLITAVGVEQTKGGRSPWHRPGWCFRKAGWEPFEKVGDGKVWLRAPRPRRTPRASVEATIGTASPKPSTAPEPSSSLPSTPGARDAR